MVHEINERPAAGEKFVAGRLRQRLEQSGAPARQTPEESRKSRGGIAFQHRDVVHSIETRQLGFEMSHRAQVRVPRVEKPKARCNKRKSSGTGCSGAVLMSINSTK